MAASIVHDIVLGVGCCTVLLCISVMLQSCYCLLNYRRAIREALDDGPSQDIADNLDTLNLLSAPSQVGRVQQPLYHSSCQSTASEFAVMLCRICPRTLRWQLHIAVQEACQAVMHPCKQMLSHPEKEV